MQGESKATIFYHSGSVKQDHPLPASSYNFLEGALQTQTGINVQVCLLLSDTDEAVSLDAPSSISTFALYISSLSFLSSHVHLTSKTK